MTPTTLFRLSGVHSAGDFIYIPFRDNKNSMVKMVR